MLFIILSDIPFKAFLDLLHQINNWVLKVSRFRIWSSYFINREVREEVAMVSRWSIFLVATPWCTLCRGGFSLLRSLKKFGKFYTTRTQCTQGMHEESGVYNQWIYSLCLFGVRCALVVFPFVLFEKSFVNFLPQGHFGHKEFITISCFYNDW